MQDTPRRTIRITSETVKLPNQVIDCNRAVAVGDAADRTVKVLGDDPVHVPARIR